MKLEGTTTMEEKDDKRGEMYKPKGEERNQSRTKRELTRIDRDWSEREREMPHYAATTTVQLPF